MIGYTNRTGLVMIVVVVLASLYACVGGYEAKADIAEQSALSKLKQPIKFSLPEHYLEMTGERVDLTNNQGE